MRGSRSSVLILSGIVVWCSSLGSAPAATVVVTINEEVPGAATGLRVGIRSAGIGPWDHARHECNLPDANRVVRCTDVPVGGHLVELLSPSGAEWLALEPIQLRIRGLIEVANAEEVLHVGLWAPRGQRHYVTSPPVSDTSLVGFYLRSSSTVLSVTLPRPTRPFEIVVPQGQWHLGVADSVGLRLARVNIDGQELPGPPFELNVPPGFGLHRLDLGYSKQARVVGKILGSRRVEESSVLVESVGKDATLQTASAVDASGRFSVDLPEGRWRLKVWHPCIVELEPASIELKPQPGETRTVEFRVLKEECEPEPRSSIVNVELPEECSEGTVRLALESVDKRPYVSRHHTGRNTGGRLTHEFAELPAGSYSLEIWGSGLRRTGVQVDQLQEHERRSVTIRPKSGATVVLVGDLTHMEQPLELSATIKVLDKELDASEFGPRQSRFDASGRAVFSGLPPGRYRLELQLQSGPQVHVVASFLDDAGKTHESVDFAVEATERHTFHVTLEPAAEVHAVVRCDDGSPIDGEVDLFVASSSEPLPETPRRQLFSNLAVKRHPFKQGELHDGPPSAAGLRPGHSHLMFSPAQFERVYYLSGTDSGESAPLTTLRGGETLDLGYVAIDCSPAVRVSLAIPGDEQVDHREFAITARGQLAAGESIEIPASARRSHHSFSLKSPVQELELTVTHPYLIPAQLTQRVAIDPNAARGSIIPVEIQGGSWGGRIEFEDRAQIGRAQRVGEKASFPIPGVVAPGRYQVQICADSSCQRIRNESRTVEVSARQTTTLR